MLADRYLGVREHNLFQLVTGKRKSCSQEVFFLEFEYEEVGRKIDDLADTIGGLTTMPYSWACLTPR